MKKQKINYKWIELIIIAWTVVFVLVITAVAATTSTYSCFQLSATSSGKVTIEATSTGWTIKAYGTDGSCGSTSTQTVTFTITNTGTNPDGTVRAVNFKITTTGMKTNSTAEAKTLDATTTKLTYTATSGKGSANYAEITINFADIVQASTGTSVTTTVIPKVGGKITVDGTAVTAKTDFANADDHTYSLTATADSGYTFIGWMSADGALNTDGVGTLSYSGQNAGTLWPLFLKSDSAMYQIKGASPMLYYAYLDEAITAAGNSGTIVVNKSGAAYHSDSTKNSFTIPSGVTLLIPYDDANTLVTKGNEVLDAYNAAVVARSEYRALTMPANTKITVASGGAISISSGRANQFIGQVGPYGAIYMDSGSNITVQSGGTLYAWGYIFHGTKDSGGSVEVESGGTVYEPISIMDYPGSSSLTTTLTDNKVFPMRSYSIRNVEVPMTLNRGAKEYVFTCLYGSNFLVGTNPLYALLIADGVVNDETPVFQNSGTITKSYANKRMIFSINGDCQLNSFTVEVSKSAGTYKISSSATTGFYIPSCWDITLTSGTTKVNDNVIMCEGSTFTVDQGATINANEKNIYVLDADNDPGAVSTSNGCGIDVQNVHGNYYTNVPKDAVLDVNGTLIASGGFYTSAAGACITSSKSGGEIQISGTSASASVNVKTTNTYEAINFSAAKLKNADGSYVDSVTNNYKYIAGFWHVSDCTGVVTTTVTQAATCTTAGKQREACSCGTIHKETEIPATGHTEVPIAGKAATCTATGLTDGVKCSVCGTVLTAQEVIPAKGHTEMTIAGKAATCTATGLTSGKKCSVCGTVTAAQTEIPALGHTEVIDVAKAPTCTATGLTEGKHCSVCNAVLVAQNEVAALGHKEVVDAAVAATCTETGLTEGKHCSVCGEVTVAQTEVAALGHTEVVDAAVAPSCTASGLTEGKHCSVCNEVLVAQSEVAALGHKEVVDAAVAPTCTATGLTEGKHCSVCNAVLVAQQTVAALGHTEVIDAAVDATCTEAGLTAGSHCDTCGEVIVAQEEVSALGHSYTSAVTPPTCGDQGYTTHTCANCGDSYKDTYIAATGNHTWGDDTICDVCKKSSTVSVITPGTDTGSGESSGTTSAPQNSLQNAVNNVTSGSVVQLTKPAANTSPSTESCTISGSKNVYIDIAGNNVMVGVAESNSGGVIYGIDSSTDKFGTPQTSVTIAAGSNVTVAPVTLDPTTGNMYISKTTTDTTTGTVTATFHRVAAKAKDYYIEARADGTAAIGISLGFRGDVELDQLENIGFDIYTGSDENTQLETVWLKGEQDASGESIQITNDTTYWVKQLAANTPNAYGDYHVYGLIKADGAVYITKTALTFNFKTVLDENWPKENATNYTESNNVLQSFYQINGLTRTVMEKEET